MTEYITTKEAAQRSGFTMAYIRLLASKGLLPGVKKFGRDWMIPVQALENYLTTERRPGPKLALDK